MPVFHTGQWRQHVALDVGTATIRIAAGMAPLIERPSRIGTRRALRDGVVVDDETALLILKPLLDRTRKFGMVKPCVLACAPSDASKEERELLIGSIMKAGAASISLIPEPLAAAIGAGIDVSSQYAQMVIDIGEGVTDCAVIRSSKIRATCAIRVGCDRMRRAIVAAAQESGCTEFSDTFGNMLMRTCGCDRSVVHPGSILTANALQSVLEELADTIQDFLRDLPHDLGCEIIESGICLTGGGALIPGVREFFEQRTGISVTIARAPRASVVEGARAILPVILALNQWR
ncbi:MAG: rod shape-determining protein [Pelobacteraceae bacterium]